LVGWAFELSLQVSIHAPARGATEWDGLKAA